MKKTILSLLFCALSAVGSQAQLLYKISGGGLAKPSYIVGTHHFATINIVNQITGVFDALTETEQVYGELVMDDAMRPDSVAWLQKAMTLPDGNTLKDVLTAEEYTRLNQFLKASMGNDLTSSAEMMVKMNHMAPMALVSNIQLLLFAKHQIGRIDPTTSLDKWFQEQAKHNGEPVGGLETVKLQARLLYQQMPLKRQAEQLMCLIDHEDFYVQALRDLTEAYYAQDLAAIEKAMDEKMNNSCDSTPEEDAALVDARNAAWVPRLVAVMHSKPTLFVVGAGHLVGEKGVLQLLRGAGYTVEAVN